MAKFQTLVLIPGDASTEDILRLTEDLLKPYGLDSEMPPYPVVCVCWAFKELGLGALSVHKELLRSNHRHLLKRYVSLPESERPEWRDFAKPFTDENREIITSQGWYRGVLPDCPNCQGTGVFDQTYNAWSEYDNWSPHWWHPSVDEAYHTSRGTYPADYSFVSQAPGELLNYAYAIVTPNGYWHDVTEYEDNWEQKRQELWKQHQDCIVVKCTMHS